MKKLILFSFMMFSFSTAHASVQPEKVHVAEQRKVKMYFKDGLVVGGDRMVTDVVVKDIRRGHNPAGFERVVLDIEAAQNGVSGAVDRAPYFQVAVNQEEKRLVVTLWGHPKLTFDAKRVVTGFRKSPVVEGVDLFPRIEEDSWTFVLRLKDDYPVEIFELSKPGRLIIDIKTALK